MELSVIVNKLDTIINSLQEQKFTTTIKIISKKSNYTQRLDPILHLENNKNYQAALFAFSTFNSIQNVIQNENDQFKYSVDSGATWKTITLHPGSYEILALNREIKRQLKIPHSDETKFNLEAETTVNRISLFLDDKHEVDFNIPRSLNNLLGFEKKIYKKGYHLAESLPKITDVNSILIHCNLVEGGYVDGKLSNALYTFPSFLTPIGYKINLLPPSLIWFPISRKSIHDVNIRITSETGKEITFGDETWVLDLLIKEV